MVKHSEWERQVRKALAEKEVNLKYVASKIGVSYSMVSGLVSGNTVKSNYLELAGSINQVLGLEDLPEKPDGLPAEQWCLDVRIAMLKKKVNVTELSEKLGYTRDRVSLVVNGRHMDEEVVAAINEFLDIPPSQIES